MELILLATCLILTIIFSIVIYFIFAPSLREKTYDEVKAEQKKKAEEYLAQGRTAKEKAKDKKLKKAGKKVKEKSNSESIEISSSDEIDHSRGHVAFVEPPEVVDEQPLAVEEKKRKKNKKKEKPILINKNETTPVIDVPEVPIINHFEQIVPKDDFTLKRSISREDVQPKVVESTPPVQKQQSTSKQSKAQPKEQPKEVKAEKAQVQKPQKSADKVVNTKTNEKNIPKSQEKPVSAPKPVEEVVVKTAAKQTQSAPALEHTKSSRKKRSDFPTLHQMSGDKEAVNVNALMPLVHKAELSRTEIQVLIDLLLNKQQGSSVESAEWTEGRQDPVAKLRKQLAEKEKALAEEQATAVGLQSQLRRLRTELNEEKHATRQLEESLAARQAELSNLGARLQHTGEEKQGLLQQIQQLTGKLTEEHRLLCKLQEDQSQAQGAMQQELLAQRQQLEVHIARLTEQHQERLAGLEAQIAHMTAQLQEQEALNSQLGEELVLARDRGPAQDLSRQIQELHSELERVKSKSQFEASRLQNEVSSLTDQLNLKRSETDKLTCVVQNLQSENKRLIQQISSACVEAQQLRQDNESLAAQVTASMERPATEGRENGDVSFTETKHHPEKSHETELLVEKLQNEIVSKEKELNHIKTELAQNESLLNSLKAELNSAHSNSEKMLKEISSYKTLVHEQESQISLLREEEVSTHKLVSTLQESLHAKEAEIVRLSRDCEQLENKESAIEKLTSELNTHKTRLADIQALTTQLNGELAKRDETIKSLTSQVKSYEAEIQQLQSELSSNKEFVSKYSQEVKDHKNKVTSLSQELEAQKRKNDELRTKNWKVMEALSTTEKTLETKVKQSHKLITEAEENARLEEQERTKQFLLRLSPHVSIDSKQDYQKWLEQFITQVRENNSGSGSPAESGGENHAAMLAEVEQQNCQLQAMVTHYKSIIADTEGMLNRLQSHVEQEEGRWGQQIQTLESQLEMVMQERDRLEENSELAAQLEEALVKNKELSEEVSRLQQIVLSGELGVKVLHLQSLQASVKNGVPTADDGSDTN